jgi:hypothetical protein
MERHKPRETSGREKGKRKGKNRNEEEIDDARKNKNNSRRVRETNKKIEKEKGTGEGRSAECMGSLGIEGIVERLVEVMNGVRRGEGFPEDWREDVICPTY